MRNGTGSLTVLSGLDTWGCLLLIYVLLLVFSLQTNKKLCELAYWILNRNSCYGTKVSHCHVYCLFTNNNVNNKFDKLIIFKFDVDYAPTCNML